MHKRRVSNSFPSNRGEVFNSPDLFDSGPISSYTMDSFTGAFKPGYMSRGRVIRLGKACRQK